LFKNKKVIIAIVILLILIVVVGKFYLDNKQRERAFADCKAQVTDIASKYNLKDVNASVEREGASDGYDWYYLSINCKGIKDLSNEDAYDCVHALQLTEVDLADSITSTNIISDNDSYEIEIDSTNLAKNNEVIYTFVSDEIKQRRVNLKDKLPYEGMLEEDIAYTKLGEPTEAEKCLDFDSLKDSHKITTYRWLDSNGDLIAIAYVFYYDFKNKRSVDGYISDFSYYGGDK
jgi:hypothetical protein